MGGQSARVKGERRRSWAHALSERVALGGCGGGSWRRSRGKGKRREKERAGGGVRVCSAHACERQRRRRRGSLGDDSGFARWGNGRRLRQGLRCYTARGIR